MSGIYIPGVEMPETCCHCAFMYFDPDATNSNNGKQGSYLCSFTQAEIWNTQRDPDCPLIPVPDHGRLIDADDMLNKYYNGSEDGKHINYAGVITPMMVGNLPTIIPGEEGE